MAKNWSSPLRPSSFPVVGVGTSAGGILALRAFFSALKTPTGSAFIVIQNLHPEYQSHLVRMLAKCTALPVVTAEDGLMVKPGCVYLAAPGQALTMQDGRLKSAAVIERRGTGIGTVDTFFQGLAAECGDRAVAVVLSGTGVDGAAGAVRVKQAGGLVFAQEPATAEHDGMAGAVIAAGAADYVLPPFAIA